MKYFQDTAADQWTRGNAYQAYLNNNTQRTKREIFGLMVKDLRSIVTKSRDLDEVEAAQTILKQMKKHNKRKRGNQRQVTNTITTTMGATVFDFNNARVSENTFNITASSTNNTPNNPSQSNPEASSSTTSNSNGPGQSTPVGASGTAISNNDLDQNTDNESNSTPVECIDHLTTSQVHPSPASSMSPSDFRERVFQASVLALKKGNLSLPEAYKIKMWGDRYIPISLGGILDKITVSLLSTDLTELSKMIALKSCASHIIDLLNPDVCKVIRKYINDQPRWLSICNSIIELPTGLPLNCKEVFEQIIRDGRDENAVLVKNLLDTATTKAKIRALTSKEKTSIEVLELLDIMTALINNFPEYPSRKRNKNNNSETYFYRRVAQILDIITRDTDLDLNDDEQVCKASTDIVKSNKRFGGNPTTVKPFGRKIDLIIAGQDLQLSTNEWKKHNVASSTVARQQSKNVRMNKAILSSLKKYDIPRDQQQHIFSLGMDWKGNAGYLFTISSYEDVYIVRRIGALMIPETLNDVAKMYDTLDLLYKWKHHHQRLVAILLSAITSSERRYFLNNVVVKDPLEIESSDNEYENDNCQENGDEFFMNNWMSLKNHRTYCSALCQRKDEFQLG